MKSGADFLIQNRTIWPDGTVRWLNGMGRILLGDHGELVRAVAISQDVSERTRAGTRTIRQTVRRSPTKRSSVADSFTYRRKA